MTDGGRSPAAEPGTDDRPARPAATTAPPAPAAASTAPTAPPPADAPTIEAVDVDLAYGREVVVAGASFTCRAGEVTALVGPNGSGKSTLLHGVAGLLAPRRGRLHVLGRPAVEVRGRVAYTLQATRVDERLPVTVRDVVTMARYAQLGLFRSAGERDRVAVQEAMERMEVADLARRRLDELSGGQRQRVFVAQGLAQRADVLLLDEPVTGLDLLSRQLIFSAIEAERQRGVTVVVTTHHLGEASAADQMILLAGRVVAVGPPRDVLTADHLRSAYGAQVLTVDGGGLVVFDDPHHHAEGDDHTHHDHG